ncbi:MAG: peptidylprolyl isomerase, partial [Clostridia bacterium]|nr:peptidylprolyl isomerase [Clostridia bacterium]
EKSFRDAINELEKKKAEANKKDAETTAETGSSGEDKKEEKDYSENFFTEGGAYKKDDAFSKWAFEEGRASGDKKIIDVLDSKEKTTGYTVYFIIKPAYKDDYLTKNVVHILYSTATNGSKEAAKKAAEAILEEFKKGDATVEDFKELAKRYTEDEGSKEDGGLYEDVKKDVMVETFNDWIYDENRKEGDTGVVETDYGAHAMYFVGNGREAWKVDSENYLKSEKYDEDIKELIEKHKVTYDLEKLALIP